MHQNFNVFKPMYMEYNKLEGAIKGVFNRIKTVQCGPFITLCLEIHRNGQPSYKGIILQRNYKKMTISWSSSYNSFVKFHGKKFGSQNMTVLYPNPCYIEVCYNGTVLYKVTIHTTRQWRTG